MAAFVTLVRANVVWIYLALALGVLFGIKILVDARRLGRTTLFSLEQERAVEETYRALGLIGVCIIAALAVTGLALFIAPLAPAQESPILRGATATLPALVFPTSTLIPSATMTVPPPTETPFVTAIPITATAMHTVVKPTAPPVVLATTALAFSLPPPVLDSKGPVYNAVVVTGEDRKNNDLKFQWTWTCDQCKLGPEDLFIVTVSFTDKASGAVRFVGGSTQKNFLTMADIIRGYGGDVWHQAKEDAFQWSVQVKRGNQPLSPPSEQWKFVWH